eukprot:Clim_evm37s146 gene=Clim_evmTU37s146
MGLCKCRVVTNLFCFEHKVNVCENCLMQDHANCIVKSYVQWLQDSDYDTDCGICRRPIGDGRETVRLLCYDIFHWECLNNYAASLPFTTAPAGYTCPKCNKSIIPSQHSASPVAVALKEKLQRSEWSRRLMGVMESAAAGTGLGGDVGIMEKPQSTAIDMGAPQHSTGLQTGNGSGLPSRLAGKNSKPEVLEDNRGFVRKYLWFVRDRSVQRIGILTGALGLGYYVLFMGAGS